jgi:hypothetical protein
VKEGRGVGKVEGRRWTERRPWWVGGWIEEGWRVCVVGGGGGGGQREEHYGFVDGV